MSMPLVLIIVGVGKAAMRFSVREYAFQAEPPLILRQAQDEVLFFIILILSMSKDELVQG
jgi:hypothetical protein